uniref:Uncharacterized protein n=1 Tax=Arundo donax TaxID=35708 RepID=A0A0A9CR69_ARUDO
MGYKAGYVLCAPGKEARVVLLCSSWRLESSCRMCSDITWALFLAGSSWFVCFIRSPETIQTQS